MLARIDRQLLILPLLALALAGCEPRTPTSPAAPVVQPVKLHQVATPGSERLRQFPAVVEAAEAAQLAFRVGGEIVSLPVKPGQEVAQGALLAALDKTDYQLVVDQAQARFELAQAQYSRGAKLIESGLMSQAQFDEIRSNMEVARANLQTARANLSYTELKAPFAGTVAQLFVENYENVQPLRTIATLQLSDAIDISIRVPENIFARVQRRTDVSVDVVFDASPGNAYQAKLKEWDTVADPATNTYKVVFSMPKPLDINALPGMSATVIVDSNEIMSGASTALVVPASAVFSPPQADGERWVWIFTPTSTNPELGEVVARAVQVGAVTNAGIEITSGLSAGEQVVVAGVHQLTEGQQVRVWVRERGI